MVTFVGNPPATWKQIAAIQKRQKTDPGYQFVAELPPLVSANS